jgi:hypothetical protein
VEVACELALEASEGLHPALALGFLACEPPVRVRIASTAMYGASKKKLAPMTFRA